MFDRSTWLIAIDDEVVINFEDVERARVYANPTSDSFCVSRRRWRARACERSGLRTRWAGGFTTVKAFTVFRRGTS